MNKITSEHLNQMIEDAQITYFHHGTLTIAVVTLYGGFQLVGTSACVDPNNYDEELGNSLAVANARNKLWELEGYLLNHKLNIAPQESRNES